MNEKVAIAVILPTRGIVFTAVEQALESMRNTYFLDVFYSTNLGIPDAQNTLVDRALEGYPYTHLFFVEEDTVPPDECLDKLLATGADIACIDYSVNEYSCVAREAKTQDILWCGLGCTLVKRRVFEQLEKPYFRSDKSFRLNDWTWIDVPMKYGGQDIYFCLKAREKGFKITQVPGECLHLKLEQAGPTETNAGTHQITVKKGITKQQIIEGGE